MTDPISSISWSSKKKQLTDQRIIRLEKAASLRTIRIRLILQDVHNPHNISACLRSADAFGIRDVDIVTLGNRYKLSTPSKGVGTWLRIKKWDNVESCAESLKKFGYKLAAAYPDQKAQYNLNSLPTDDKIAVIFANEHEGASPDWEKHIDYRFTIPMFGLVESLNISVSCAITLHSLRNKAQHHPEFLLNQTEQEQLLNEWARIGTV